MNNEPQDAGSRMRPWNPQLVGVLLALVAASVPLTSAAQTGATTAPPAVGTVAPAPGLPQRDLDQLLAPIALYPDALLLQMLMASTYPLEVVAAERWVKANPRLSGKALEDALAKQPWNASVKALTPMPQVLKMMSDQLDWTQKLGDAYLAGQQEVMSTVQNLRSKAYAAGTLTSTSQQKVVTESVGGTTIITIAPAQPQVVYVPVYNPSTVYGTWWYVGYPPYAYYPPGYVAAPGLAFATGVAVGTALWGRYDWHYARVDIDINHYNSFNRTTVNNVSWNHNPAHRGVVPYADKTVAQRYSATNPNGAAARGGNANTVKPVAQPAPRSTTVDSGRPRPGANRDDVGGPDRGGAPRR